ncbi:MAG: RluA family pseudouridine synthase [Thiotrichales bacterium]
MADEYYPAREVTIEADRAGQRLDNFLFNQFKALPKTRIYKMLRKGEVRVNGGRIRQTYRIQAGDRVRLPPVRIPGPKDTGASSIPPGVLRAVEASILYEDDELLVLNKPSGIAVHAGSGLNHGVIEALRELRPTADFLELVHRLDRPTSGLLLVAKQRTSLLALHKLLKNGGVKKTYLALVSGRWKGGGRRITQNLARTGGKGQIRQTRTDQAGKEAISRFTPKALYEDASLMQVRIDTGRTHQIRVHGAESGHPVLGDDRYGDFDANRRWRKRGLRRLFLHASEVEFTLPSGTRRFQAPLPDDLQTLLESLSGPEENTKS